MSSSSPVALPPSLQRRGEIVGAICGLVSFPLPFNLGGCAALLPVGPSGVILPMVLGSALAGVIGCIAGRSGDEEQAGLAPRVGIRAGLVAALVGGAVTVFAATVHAVGIGHPAAGDAWQTIFALILPGSRPWQTFIIALLGLPPAIFFGMAGSFAAAMLRLPPLPGTGGAKAKQSVFRSTLFIVILALSAIGYLSPLTIPFFPKTKPVVVAPVLPTVVAPPPAPAPAPPKWTYRRPDGLDTTEAQNIEVSNRLALGEIAAEMPVALAPDGRHFAYCVGSSDGVGIVIRDLDNLDTLARFTSPEEPTGLAWSSDSRRLLLVAGHSARRVAVFDPGENRLYPLPQPKDAWLPVGLPFWWDAKEVLFTAENKAVAVLNLDTLRARPFEESAKWKGLTKEQQEEAQRRSSNHLATTPSWQMAWRGYVRDYNIPAKGQPWRTNEQLQFALVHPAKSYERIFPIINVAMGDAFVAAGDGSKLVRISKQQAEVFYFDLRKPQALSFQVKMPAAPDSSLTDALTKKNLCGFVCAPLVNPLNGKTVGPDRGRVKALARIASWSEREARVWIETDCLPVQPGDVLADLHTWEERNPKGAGEAGRGEWWTVIEPSVALSEVPLRKDVSALDRKLNVSVTSNRGAERLEAVEVARPRRPAASVPPASVPAPPPPAVPAGSPANDDAQELIANFIIAHHAKSSRNDIDGLVSDYAEQVDHFDKNVVDREFIRKEEVAYHAPGYRISERVVTPIRTVARPGGEFEASYTISSERVRPDGRWARGLADITLRLNPTPEGFRINFQRAVHRNQQKGP
jgi:hypothetical protein